MKEDTVYCVIDGYIETAIGKIPNATFLEGSTIALKYSALVMLLNNFEKFLNENEDKYSEVQEFLDQLKTEAYQTINNI